MLTGITFYFSRVHVTEDTYKLIKDSYDVEDGCGGDRNEWLKENNIPTYFVRGPKPHIVEAKAKESKKSMKHMV